MVWIALKPAPYHSTGGQEADAANRYSYQPDPGCTPQDLAQLPSLLEREAKRRECANQAQDHRRELDDLTQQTRAAEAVEKANWLGQQNLYLAYWQLGLAALGALGLLASLHQARKATLAAVRGEGVALAAVEEAREANRITQRANAVDQRPWLKISDPTLVRVDVTPLTEVPGEERLGAVLVATFDYSITNNGKTPALNVSIFSAHGEHGSIGLASLSHNKDTAARESIVGTNSIAPGETTLEKGNFAMKVPFANGTRVGAVLMQMSLWVAYTSFNDNSRHVTKAVYLFADQKVPNSTILTAISLNDDDFDSLNVEARRRNMVFRKWNSHMT